MQLKSILFVVFSVAVVSVTVAGCTFFTPERIAAIQHTVATAIQIAYESGGRDLAFSKIDEMVTDGKLSEAQAVQLKAAAEKGYQAFVARLTELADNAQ